MLDCILQISSCHIYMAISMMMMMRMVVRGIRVIRFYSADLLMPYLQIHDKLTFIKVKKL